MASFNQVTLVGRLTRDPELSYTQGGTAIAKFGLAIDDRVKRGDEWVDEPVFVDVTFFGRTAEVVGEYLKKGSPALLAGRLKLDQWTDRNSGQKRQKLHVVGDRMQMLGERRSEPAAAEQEYEPEPQSQPSYGRQAAVDDIPF